MADALISLVIDKLATTTYEEIEKEVRLVLEVEKEVEKATSKLTAIQAVLEDAEKEQVTKATVRNWLEKLTDVSYEMDDMLDEWSTRILMEVESQEKEGESVLVTKKKVCFSIPSGCFCFGRVNRLVLRSNIAHKIGDLNDRLNEIAKEQETFKFQHTQRRLEVPAQQHKITVSFLDKTFGREDESKHIVDMPLSESSDEERDPLVIPIVGMGGMGKTTLAQLAYNNESVKVHFDKRVWVCVSNPFDEIKVSKCIIGDVAPNSDDLEVVFQCLAKSIEGKKFLIVLDDVWTKWENLKLPLQKGAIGSKILVTTRKKDVALVMGARESHLILLEQLNERSCWLLFSHFAFSNWEEAEYDKFVLMGKEIVKRCKGLPLAVKSLGSLMNLKTTRKEWQNILDSKIWELKEVEQDVFQPLLLSYYDLTSVTKRCLLYCVIFPKDYKIEKDELIELWMSQDYLSLESNQKKETVGENHFNDLVRRSFFQDFEKDYRGMVTVKMHDIVHDFVQFLTKKECFIGEVKDAKERIELSGGKVHHLTLMRAREVPYASLTSLSPLISFDNCKYLRTLTTSNLKFTKLDPDFILQLKCLRTLKLGRSKINELPKEIGELIHLRYVDLSDSKLKELPDAMCNLYNLETLNLNYCRELEKLPKPIGKLKNLRYLYLEACRKLQYFPKGIGRLTSLRKLERDLNVDADDDNEAFKLADIKHLDKLQGGLNIYELGNVKHAREAEEAQLWNKKDILNLRLNFKNGDEWREGKNDVDILNALQPPQNLEYLWIRNYRGTIGSPKWMISLQNLTQLSLVFWRNCELLPPLGKLPSLEFLWIWIMPRVKKVGVELLGIEELSNKSSSSSSVSPPTPTLPISFPKLKTLRFDDMPEWEEWESRAGEHSEITIMPCLSKLTISSARRLKALPDFLRKISTLHQLDIWRCTIVERGCRRAGSERPKISHIPNIILDFEAVRIDGVWRQDYNETDESAFAFSGN